MKVRDICHQHDGPFEAHLLTPTLWGCLGRNVESRAHSRSPGGGWATKVREIFMLSAREVVEENTRNFHVYRRSF